ncbi:MAG: PAS domain S-box protein [Pseudomonadota bacterium]|nr:PAS domain S-box protein [Pseudomonadota bacterium]
MPAFERDRWRQLFDQAPGFMAISNGPDHVLEMVNESYMRMVGRRDLVGKTVREAFPDLEGQHFFSLLDHVYKSGQPVSGRARPLRLQRTADGEPEERLLDFVFQPFTNEDGKVVGIFAQGNDVTEQHVVELALRESEERFRLIADSAPVPMWVTRIDRRRSFVNRAYQEFLGVAYEESLNFDWRTRIHPDDAQRLLAESLAGEATLKPFALEGRYLRHDGKWRWLRSESQPRWGPHGEHVGFIGIAHDITEAKEAEAKLREMNETLERRVAERTADLKAALDRLQAEVADRLRAEEALRQAQKMEAVGQLTGGIAHDFNNLLTPIMGGLEIISSRLTDERLKRVAQTGLDAAQRGAKLTGQLLAFSRTQRISMAPVHVNQVVDNMKDLLRHAIGSEVHVDLVLDPTVEYARCDANQLENALLNLALNARDAMPGGGSITLSTSRVSLDTAADLAAGDYVQLMVTDTGAGMPPEVLARATEPFFSTKPPGKGTGLGLAQVYGIARQSGGALRIESMPGHGTTVRILLPEASAEVAGGEASVERVAFPGARTSAAETHILIIDDDQDVRAFLSSALGSMGYSVAEADCGEAGLRRLEESRPDLVLLDYAMPGMHGADVARIARERDPSLPIVFVTGYAVSDQLEAALGRDVPVLRKPFTVAQLAALVEEQLACPKAAAQGA